eukprot:6559761-Prymnesium_polylepis.1
MGSMPGPASLAHASLAGDRQSSVLIGRLHPPSSSALYRAPLLKRRARSGGQLVPIFSRGARLEEAEQAAGRRGRGWHLEGRQPRHGLDPVPLERRNFHAAGWAAVAVGWR